MKYWDFTADLLPRSIGGRLPRWDFVMPLGLSFFTFQSMGYVIDVYRGKYEAQRNPARYALFVSFFPQMVQGPIGRYDALAPQLLGRAGTGLAQCEVRHSAGDVGISEEDGNRRPGGSAGQYGCNGLAPMAARSLRWGS